MSVFFSEASLGSTLCIKRTLKDPRSLRVPSFHTYPSFLGSTAFGMTGKNFFNFLKDFIHSFERRERSRERKREAQTPH